MLDVFSHDVSRSKALVMSTFSVEQDLLRELMEVNPEIRIHLIAAKDECDKLKDIQGARLHLTPLETRTAILNRIHAKVYLFLREGGAKCYVGTFNMTRSGMENNVEFFAEFEGRYIQSALTLEDFENHQELPFWRGFCQDNVVNGVAQFLNSIINGRFEGPFLSDRIADYHRETPIFIHTLGKKTIPLQIQSHIKKKASDCKYAKLRFVSPYHTTGSIQKFADLVCQNIGCRAKIELLTNFVPDFRNRYDEKSFLDPSSIDELKELLSAKKMELEVRFWDRHGYEEEEIPGRFLHGKLLLVEFGGKSGTKDHCIFLLSSNLTAAGLGLDRPPNLEAGLFDDDRQRSANLWNLFDGIWKRAKQASDTDTWKQIEVALKRISAEDIFFTREIKQLDCLTRKAPLRKRGKTVSARIGQETAFQYGLSVVIPSAESLKDFLKGRVLAQLDKTGIDFSKPRLSFSLKDLRGFKPTESLSLDMAKKGDKWIVEPEALRNQIPRGFTIDSVALLVDTNRVGDPVFFRVQDLDKGRRLNLLEINGTEVVLYDFMTRWVSSRADSIAALASTETGVCKLTVRRDFEDLVVEFPSRGVLDGSREVMIFQESAETHPRILYEKILGLKPVKDPILSVKASIETVSLPENDEISALKLDMVLENELIGLDSSDFLTSIGMKDVKSFGFTEKVSGLKKHLSLYLPHSEGEAHLIIGLLPPIGKWYPELKREVVVSSQQEFPQAIFRRWARSVLNGVGIRLEPPLGFATGDSEILVIAEKPRRGLLAHITPMWGEYDSDSETIAVRIDSESVHIGKFEPGITLAGEFMLKDGDSTFLLQRMHYPIRQPLFRSAKWRLPFKDHLRSFTWLSRLFVFAVEVSMESEDDDIIDWVKSFRFEVNGRILEPVKMQTTAVNQDKLVLYFKNDAITESVDGILRLSCVAESRKFFAAQKIDAEVRVRYSPSSIDVSIGKDTKRVLNGDPRPRMGPIRDNVKELHYYLELEKLEDAYIVAGGESLFLQTAPEKRENMRRQLRSVGLDLTERGDNWYIDSDESILPVWFRPRRYT